MVTRERRPVRRLWESMSAAVSRAARLGDMPAVLVLVWAGWLAVPLSLSGLAQARAAIAAGHETPQGAAETAVGHRAEARTFTAPPKPGRGWAGFTRGATASDAWPGPQPAAYAGDGGLPCLAAHATGGISAPPPHATPGSGSQVPGPAWGSPGAGEASHADGAAVARELARERARIAGEVHDAAGHGFSTIAMQAGLALLVLEESPEQARESLRAIRETSLGALAQLRAALDLIDPGEPVASRDDLPALIDGVRAAGLPVDMEPGEPAVPSHLRGTVYRVVRESLTNVIRHAGPTRALVRVADDPCGFVLEVADRGVGVTEAGEGRGLAGMRERVRNAGGQFTAGPRDGGGFQVIARFPRETA